MSDSTLESDGLQQARSRACARELLSILAVSAFLLACLAVATDPLFEHLDDRLVGASLEPIHQLWLMDQARQGALGGPENAGFPSSSTPPSAGMSRALYGLLLPILGNDILTFNVLWLSGMLGFGLSSTFFIRRFVPHRWSAAFGGMLAMLSAPVLLRSQGYLDTLPLAFIPLFLAFWFELLDRPRGRYLLASTVCFTLASAGAVPHGVLASVPAVFYLLGSLISAARGNSARAWLRSRLPWLVSWSALAFALHALALRVNLIPSASVALASLKPTVGVPLWSYLLPTSLHRLIAIAPVDFYHHAALGGQLAERASYLGVVTLILLHQAVLRGSRFPHSRFLWSSLAVLVLLSCGESWRLWSWTVSLPVFYLRQSFDVFRLVELPSQFNLLAVLLASTIAAAAFYRVLCRFQLPRRRVALYVSLTLVALFDLSLAPFGTTRLPLVPPAFARLLERDPTSPLLEIPQVGSSAASSFAVTDLWRTRADLRVSASSRLAAQDSRRRQSLSLRGSPFQLEFLSRPEYLAGQASGACGLVAGTTFDHYLWLYAHTQAARYLVVQKWLLLRQNGASALEALEAKLAPALIDEDRSVAIYDVRRLPEPTQPVLAIGDGWHEPASPAPARGFTSEGSLRVFVPDSRWRIQLALSARSLRWPRSVRLVCAGKEITRWVVIPGRDETLLSPPLKLTPGIHDLRVVADRPVSGSGPEPTRVSGRVPVRISVGTVALQATLAEQDEVPQVATDRRVNR